MRILDKHAYPQRELLNQPHTSHLTSSFLMPIYVSLFLPSRFFLYP